MVSGKELERDNCCYYLLLLLLFKEGYKGKDIAIHVGIGVLQVQKWIKRFRDGGDEAPFLSSSCVLQPLSVFALF